MISIDSSALTNKRLVVVIGAIGPYHAARLSALNDRATQIGVELIVVQRAGLIAEYPWFGQENNLGFEVVNAYSERDPSPNDLKSAIQLVRTVRKLRPDTVAVGLSHRPYLGVVAWSLAANHRLVLLTETKADDARRNLVSEWLKKRVYRRFSAALVGGPPHADYAASLGIARDCCFYGYDVVDNLHFSRLAVSARENADSLRAKYQLPTDYFVAAKRFIPKKNILPLLRAYSMYREEVGLKAWSLVLMGDGPQREEIRQECQHLSIDGSVKMPGLVVYGDLPTYYGLGRALIHASLVEPWGLVINEAMASGLPILIAKNCGAASLLLQEGVNGIGFDPSSVEQMKSAMVAFHRLSDAARCDMGGQSARIVSQWGTERFAEGMLQAMHASL